MPAQNRTLTYAAILVVSIMVGFGAVYVSRTGYDNSQSDTRTLGAVKPGAAKSRGTPLTNRHSLAKGDMAGFVLYKSPRALADVSFKNASGSSLSLSNWKDKVVLLNLWATWCAPCRKEMPDLDRLQAELGSDRFEVVTLAVDRAGIEGAGKFFKKIGIKSLDLYVDSTARAGSALKVVGMPTTLLIGPDGREVGRLTGPAKWDGDDAKALLRSLIATLTREAG